MSISIPAKDPNGSNLSINFDRQWKMTQISNQNRNEHFMKSDYDDHEWSFVDLPHQMNLDHSVAHWYRKEFQWKESIDSQQHVYLSFDSTNTSIDQTDNQEKIPLVVCWLNETKIYAGPLPNPIDITKYLRVGTKNLLAICSPDGYSLSVDARIFLPKICAGEVELDEIDQKTHKKQRHKLDYAVSFNPSDGLVNLVIDPFKFNQDILRGTSIIDEKGKKTEEITTEQPLMTENNSNRRIPILNIVLLIVGTRGDVQPFVALAKVLRDDGHNVRFATHGKFKEFVEGNGLKFFPLGGNPDDLISFMVKNAGIVPSVSSIVAGDIAKNRDMMKEILDSTWDACIKEYENGETFVADAIIANPPSYGHIHCAQKLQIPLHMMFTMPWSPTTEVPHPFCQTEYTRGPVDKINYLSYGAIEMMTWTGIGDKINEFRANTLDLPKLHTRQAVELLIEEKVPFLYCWSPKLLEKPPDWGPHIDVAGFFFLDLATNYTPDPALQAFLDQGPPPIYIGFGSIRGHDSERITRKVLRALTETGYRALLSGFKVEESQLPPGVLKIDNCPHDWLFQHVVAVCHHGGAGTTAAGLRAGKPTIIVPFFGDQYFWGATVSRYGAGPTALPGSQLKTQELADAFRAVHDNSEYRLAAEKLRDLINQEDGCRTAVQAFYKNLPLEAMRSDIESSYPACIHVNGYDVKISRPVAQVLIGAGKIKESELRLHPTRDWTESMIDNRPHVPTHGLFKHGQKALSSLLVEPAQNIRRAVKSQDFTTGTLDAAESIVRGVGKCIGHVSLGGLALVGEVTDTLQALPKLYDPYRDIDYRERPRIKDLASGAKAAEESIYHGVLDGVTGLVNKPRAGYKKHGPLGGIAGTAVALPNLVFKPVGGILSFPTCLARGVYAEARAYIRRHGSEGCLALKAHMTAEQRGSVESNLDIEVCRRILDQFERIQQDYERRSSASSSSTISVDSQEPSGAKKHTKHKLKLGRHCLQRQRSHSATGQ